MRPQLFREVKRKLEAAGFAQVSQRGSHVKFLRRDEQGIRTAIVPQHREIQAGTLRSILRQAGISPEEFDSL
jgi:predicted RNA binding protein YcfA (HicA-like mRNA interferase family)